VARQHWILKSEPKAYGYAQLEKDGRTEWSGIRNFAARLHLRAAKEGDLALFFHTGDEKAVVGVAKLTSGPRADPTAKGEDWTSVELAPVKALKTAVPLAALKADQTFHDLPMLKQGRLSVSPISAPQFAAVLKLGKTKL
jgi:predicted RNA-binding protein with PUA-like domain